MSGLVMPNWLVQRAYLTPDRPALIGPDPSAPSSAKALTFADLARRTSSIMCDLDALGVGGGDRVALLLPNGLGFAEALHAISGVGAVAVPLNLRLTVEELAWQIADADASVVTHDYRQSDVATELLRALPRVAPYCLGVGKGWEDSAQPRDATEARLDNVHSIVYTSGTTGRPKGAELTYGNHWWSAVSSALNLGLHADDRWLACLPFYHVGGLSILLRGVIYGMEVVILERFDPAAVNRSIDTDGVTIVSVVSTMLQGMLDERDDSHPYPPSLRCVLLGGGPAPRPLLERCAARGVPVVQSYGLTETASQIVTLAPEDALTRLGSAGKPLFPSEVRIERDGDWAEAHHIGEIVVRGPTVTRGYHGRRQETSAVMRDGWLHTGDLGYLDAEGYLYVIDRRDDLIISGGENVYPAEVEAVLLSHPDVAEAAVVGIADGYWGQVVTAVVVPRRAEEGGPEGRLSEAEVIAHCAARMSGYKVPKHVRFIDALPRSGAGKLVRRALRA